MESRKGSPRVSPRDKVRTRSVAISYILCLTERRVAGPLCGALCETLVRKPCAESGPPCAKPLCGTGVSPWGMIPLGDDSPGGPLPGERFPWGTIPQGGLSQGNDSPGRRFPRGVSPRGMIPLGDDSPGGVSPGGDFLGSPGGVSQGGDSPGERFPRGSLPGG